MILGRRAVSCSVAALLVFLTVAGGGGIQSAFAEATPTPPPSPSAGVPASPTLQAMNDARDHQMGSTIPQFEPRIKGQTLKTQVAPDATAVQNQVSGMDISGWQPNVDWNAAWSSGARFVYIKATEGTSYVSSHFSGQYDGATTAGMVRGAYHFATPNESSGASQANYFVDHGGGWSADGITLPPMLDIEYDPYTGTDGTDSCWGLSQSQMVAWIADFSNTVLSRTGIRPTIYSTTSWWTTCTGNNPNFGADSLFIARWPSDVSQGAGTLPAGWGSYTFWQFSDQGTLPGDQDQYNGDIASLHLYASNGTQAFITALYKDFLSRVPSAAEIGWWEGVLGSGAPRTAIADGFVNSTEYRLLRINAAYNTILGRPSDPGGVQNWLSAMNAGVITTDDIETSFYASQEYYQQHGNTDTGFVASLYQTLLHRTGAASEYAYWTGLVHQNGRAWVIAQFWDSTETISERVSAMYQLYLGRTPDAQGLAGWVSVALQIGDSGLRAAITSSQEYFNRAQTR